ncbi:hypothetical protein Tco_0678613 [Tanacetum coccineum]|uniref:Uncharacterized protein n=1 Tax=Tanacetum coccineum TaxID=301880 RepID=A0ABQ4XFQ6_9ASTR
MKVSVFFTKNQFQGLHNSTTSFEGYLEALKKRDLTYLKEPLMYGPLVIRKTPDTLDETHVFRDYGFAHKNIPCYCDIPQSYYLLSVVTMYQALPSNHIDILHHFIREQFEKVWLNCTSLTTISKLPKYVHQGITERAVRISTPTSWYEEYDSGNP